MTSPFLDPGPIATAENLAIIHLKRDHQVPTILKERDDDNEGYLEGKVVNTRFGSFPHSTLIGLPWGSQVRASKVDTGSRGRRVKGGGKRKRDDFEAKDSGPAEDTSTAVKEAVAASSGFVHLLPPTPENWTSSLPHRTQVVYTPDYSYILFRLRARPGTNIIEAGAGSGSFTHASARAVYNGYQAPEDQNIPTRNHKMGKVWSYEFHAQRHAKLEKEIQDHGLDGIVQITHRDVCQNGFLLAATPDGSPNADAVFLDLPAPWLALPHLTRQSPSPLNPNSTIHICTFSPCIEQVQRTVSALRRLGWVDISMVEVTQKRLEIRRDRIGIENGLHKGVQATPTNVEDAVARLLEVEERSRSFHSGAATRDCSLNKDGNIEEEGDENMARVNDDTTLGKQREEETGQINEEPVVPEEKDNRPNPNNHAAIITSLLDRKIYKEGRLVHRAEQELKTHTSYLVFAVLPREWSAEDEESARTRWPLKRAIRRKDPNECDESDQQKDKVVGLTPWQARKMEKSRQKKALQVVAKTTGHESDEGVGMEPKKEKAETSRLDSES